MNTYDIVVSALVPVKRVIRMEGESELNARLNVVAQINEEIENQENHQWSVPSRSRSSADSDHDLLGPEILIHHSGLLGPFVTGMCPKLVSEETQ